MPMKHNLLGTRYGRLTGIAHVGKGNWHMRCDCGTSIITNAWQVVNGKCRSCGCISREQIAVRSRIHGRTSTPEYISWAGAKSRCMNPHSQRYPMYGGRGIDMCPEWKDSFARFFADMGAKPTRKHSLDRIDCNGDYCPANCRWATQTEQTNNTRRNAYITCHGITLTAAEWSRRTGIKACTIRDRINKHGYSPERALTPGWRASVAIKVP